MEAVIYTPMPPMTDADNAVCVILRHRAEQMEWEHPDCSEAICEYGKAAAKGSILSFREIVRIADECGESLLAQIVRELKARKMTGEVADEDLEYIKSKLGIPVRLLRTDELEKTLHIAINYDVLGWSVQSVVNVLIGASGVKDDQKCS